MADVIDYKIYGDDLQLICLCRVRQPADFSAFSKTID